jgi:hypothetical protein
MLEVRSRTPPSPDAGGLLTTRRRVMPSVGLLLLAPLVAEYLLAGARFDARLILR